jgi:hypothetical protein
MGGDLDLFQKTHWEPEGDRGRARLKVGQPNALGPASVEIGGRVLAFPIGLLFGLAGEGDRGLTRLFHKPTFRALMARASYTPSASTVSPPLDAEPRAS